MSVNLGNDTKATSPVRTPEETKESKYEPKQNKKIFRLLTVIAYVISVSMAAIILSLYYVFLWDPKMKYITKSKVVPLSTKAPSSEETAPALNSQYFSLEDMAAKSDLMDGQPTPKVMSVLRGESEVLPQHTSPTHPVPQQANDASNHLGHSPPSEQQQQQHQQQQQEQRHQHQHQQRHHQQGVEPIPTSA